MRWLQLVQAQKVVIASRDGLIDTVCFARRLPEPGRTHKKTTTVLVRAYASPRPQLPFPSLPRPPYAVLHTISTNPTQ